MRSEQRLHRKGIALVVAAAIAWSTAPFFTRLLHYDSWTILFWRGLFGGAFIAVYLFMSEGRAGITSLFTMRRTGWLVACLSTIGMVTFIPALQMTSVANVAIIVAVQPFAAAAMAWLWMRETIATRTLVASLVALSGIAVIVSAAVGTADYRGIGLACVMMIAISLMTVAMRRFRETSMVPAAAISNFLGSAVSIAFAHDLAAVAPPDLAIFALFGLFQVAVGLTLFALGSRLLPSGQASLIATLETPLMPFWVWIAFQEVPSLRTLAGGILVLGAVVADILADIRARRVSASPATQ